MRSYSWISALVAAAVGLTSVEAQAQNEGDAALALTTTFGPTALTTTGGVVAIILLTRKPESQQTREAAQAAELFLRDHHLQLAQDLATGKGPLLAELARGLSLRPENAAAFGPLLRQHRKELLGFCDVSELTRERAREFAQKLTSILHSHEGIRRDLLLLAESHPIR